MKIRIGYELIFDFPQYTPVIMVLGTHVSRTSDVIVPAHLTPDLPLRSFPTATSSAIGAAASSLLPAKCACQRTE